MEVKVYSASWCPYCHAEMEWLDDIGVKYKEIDVEEEGVEVENLPVTEIGDKRVVGFDRTAIQRALREHGLIK